MTTRSASSLALFTGQPAFPERLHVGRPNLGDRERLMSRIGDILDSRWLTNHGPYAVEFERQVAERLQVRHCVATCNGTIALELLTRALDMKGEVIIPSFTFVATAHALQWQEIRPVFADVDRRSHTLDPTRVEELITPNTTGIMGVHLWGRACDTDGLQAVADRHGLPLIYDASHAFQCSHQGRPIGGFGRAEVFSFHATKVLNTFEGGAIVTDDSALAEKLRLMRNFGFHSKDDVIYLGSNGKMSEVNAAMGLTGLESLDEFIDANRRNYRAYREHLNRIPGVAVFPHPEDEACNYHYVVATVDAERTGLDRDALVTVLEAENVLARRYFHPACHRMEPYRSLQPTAGLVLPVTEELSGCVMTLPTGQTVTPETIERIAEILQVACENADEIRARLAGRPYDPRPARD